MRKGISPLVAVIMLVAFTMTMAVILASWAQNYASSSTEEITECAESGIKIYICKWITGTTPNGTLKIVVQNTGDYNLTFDVVLTFSNETRHPGLIQSFNEGYYIDSHEYKTVTINNVSDDLSKVKVESRECLNYGVLDSISKLYITGLPS